MPRPRSPRSLAPALTVGAIAAASLLAACSDKDPTSPVVTPGPSTVGRITVAQYMDSALTLMQTWSIKQQTNWTTFRARWKASAAGKTTYAQLYPVIDSALTALDPHSSISPPDQLPGTTDAPTNRPDLQVQSRLFDSASTRRVGYLWVPGFIGTNQSGRIDTTHAALRALDAQNPCGWIVDLRTNNGGFFFALMASVGPLYSNNAAGDGLVGGQQFPGNYQILWYYKQRGARDVFGIRDTRDSAELAVNNPWRPRRPGLPVAVLHSTARNAAGQLTSITASSGESITLAFRGGPPTRSFGNPTYGVASGRDPFMMPDSARIDITSSYMFDRNRYMPGDFPIPPDTTIASPSPIRIGDAADPVIAAATAWVQRQAACTGTAVQTDGIPAPRMQLVPTGTAGEGPSRLPSVRSVYRRAGLAPAGRD